MGTIFYQRYMKEVHFLYQIIINNNNELGKGLDLEGASPYKRFL